MEEHGGHLTHLHPLHNVKVVQGTSRPLCQDTGPVRRETGQRSKEAAAGKHREQTHFLWLRLAAAGDRKWFPGGDTHGWTRWACSLAPVGPGPPPRPPSTPRWRRSPPPRDNTHVCSFVCLLRVCVCVNRRIRPSHLLLLPPLPAQLSVGCCHGLDHEGGGHVAGERSSALAAAR